MLKRRSLLLGLLSTSAFTLSGCMSGNMYKGVAKEARHFPTPDPVPTEYFPQTPPFPTWTEVDDSYRFYPGDEIEISVPSAPELTKSVIVAPDGRITPTLLPSIMVADRTPEEVKQAIMNLYASQLRNPQVFITPKTFVSQKLFVGGEVAKPGIYDINGEIDPVQAIILAGGFLNSAKREDVVVMRRGAGGQPFMRTYDLKTIFAKDGGFSDLPRLRRFDIVWVPRSKISEVGLFTQQFIREALPITVGFNYSINGGRTY
ncbi:polysaccharide biosynthesis/export family protein [Pseudaquidulcibacter saccharophilus]|uniref:polysaccharide biosynthesis/export family protein n=1 Tax=Pseudaquidulcibacter saccharophilus TaxID=2831900 RepID=UPI001EFF06DF|nr:polysaccharide biosynthesis/export family protein [Pseudaquidulcibacter saccharophilus]